MAGVSGQVPAEDVALAVCIGLVAPWQIYPEESKEDRRSWISVNTMVSGLSTHVLRTLTSHASAQ